MFQSCLNPSFNNYPMLLCFLCRTDDKIQSPTCLERVTGIGIPRWGVFWIHSWIEHNPIEWGIETTPYLVRGLVVMLGFGDSKNFHRADVLLGQKKNKAAGRLIRRASIHPEIKTPAWSWVADHQTHNKWGNVKMDKRTRSRCWEASKLIHCDKGKQKWQTG